jgi:hypothetical protein
MPVLEMRGAFNSGHQPDLEAHERNRDMMVDGGVQTRHLVKVMGRVASPPMSGAIRG